MASTDQLAPFSERQTALLAHLATQLAARPIGLAEIQDFDPEEELLEEPIGLPLFEAVMLDLSLSGPPAARRMLTEEQSDARTEQATRGARRLIAAGVAGVSVLVAAFAAVIGILANATTHLWTGIALTAVCVGLSYATWLARANPVQRSRAPRRPMAGGARRGPAHPRGHLWLAARRRRGGAHHRPGRGRRAPAVAGRRGTSRASRPKRSARAVRDGDRARRYQTGRR